MFCVDKIKYEYLAILSNLKSCQFVPSIVINLCICCQFEDSQLILPKIISYGPLQHLTVTNEGSFFWQKIFLFHLVHNSEFLENLIKNYCIRTHFDVV